MTDTLTLQAMHRQLLKLIMDDMRTELAVGTNLVAILAEPFWQVEDDSLREDVELLCQRDKRLPRFRLNILASTTVSLPRASRLLTNVFRRSKASLVAD